MHITSGLHTLFAAVLALAVHSASSAQSVQERVRIAVNAAGGPEAFLKLVAADQTSKAPTRPMPHVEIRRVTQAELTLTYQGVLLLIPSKASFDPEQLKAVWGAAYVCSSGSTGVLIREYGVRVVYEFFANNGEYLARQEIDKSKCPAAN